VSLRADLTYFKSFGNTEGYYLIKNLDCDPDLMPTPVNHSDVQQHKKTFVSESNLAIIGSFLGVLYGYKQESEGCYFNNIRPTVKSKIMQSSESSDVFLELHTEIAFHDVSPDFLLLYCLRSDRESIAKTGISSIRNAVKLLTKDQIKILRSPLFDIGIDYSFLGRGGKESTFKTLPILNGPKDDPYMIYDSDLMVAKTESAALAIKALDNALRLSMKFIYLKPGDLIVIDNKRCVHSRTAFKAHFDEQDRWLQRVFVKKCTYLAESLYEEKLDVIVEDFSA
jgi:L-asparagine oxygenase